MNERFTVIKEGLAYRLYDNKLQEPLNVYADHDALVEVARICNNLDRKNRCCQKKVEVLSKFADADKVNEYWEMMTE